MQIRANALTNVTKCEVMGGERGCNIGRGTHGGWEQEEKRLIKSDSNMTDPRMSR